MSAQVLRDIPFYATFFGFYEFSCRYLRATTKWNDTSVYFVSGGLAGQVTDHQLTTLPNQFTQLNIGNVFMYQILCPVIIDLFLPNAYKVGLLSCVLFCYPTNFLTNVYFCCPLRLHG